MEPKLDTRMRQSLHQDQLALGAGPLTRLIEAIGKAARESDRRQLPLALLVDQKVRRPLKRLLARTSPEVGVIAYQEVPNDLIIDSAVMLQYDDIVGPEAAADSQQLRGAA